MGAQVVTLLDAGKGRCDGRAGRDRRRQL